MAKTLKDAHVRQKVRIAAEDGVFAVVRHHGDGRWTTVRDAYGRLREFLSNTSIRMAAKRRKS